MIGFPNLDLWSAAVESVISEVLISTTVKGVVVLWIISSVDSTTTINNSLIIISYSCLIDRLRLTD